MDIFKVIYETTMYKDNLIIKEPVVCYFNDINKIKETFGLSKEEIIHLYYGIGFTNVVKNSVVKSIEKFIEQEQNAKDKPKFCVHFT
jgi:hypothetical protein